MDARQRLRQQQRRVEVAESLEVTGVVPGSGRGAAGAVEPHGRRPLGVGDGFEPSEPYYVFDWCCGGGGFTWACLLARFPVKFALDFCVAKVAAYKENFAVYGVECFVKSMLDRDFVDWLVRLCPPDGPDRIGMVTFSPPCQPYCLSGEKNAQDERVRVLKAGVKGVVALRPAIFVLECVRNLERCQWNPVWKDTVLPALVGPRGAGYECYVCHLNASTCDIPVNRDRMFAVFTLYPRSGLLERRMEALRLTSPLPLCAWYAGRYWRHLPCRNSPATFDGKTKPAPCARTSCLRDVDVGSYVRRKGDVCDVADARPLSVAQRQRLSGLPRWYRLPSLETVCTADCCARAPGSRLRLSVASVILGNIVVAQQALQVLLCLEPPPLRGPISRERRALRERCAATRQRLEQLRGPEPKDALALRNVELAEREAAEASWRLAKAQSSCEERLVRLYVAEQPRCRSQGRRSVKCKARQFEIELARAVFEQATCERGSARSAEGVQLGLVQRSGYVLPSYAHRLPRVTKAVVREEKRS